MFCIYGISTAAQNNNSEIIYTDFLRLRFKPFPIIQQFKTKIKKIIIYHIRREKKHMKTIEVKLTIAERKEKRQQAQKEGACE